MNNYFRGKNILEQHQLNNKKDIDVKESTIVSYLKNNDYLKAIKEISAVIDDKMHPPQYHWDLIAARIMNHGYNEILIKSLIAEIKPDNSYKTNYILGIIYQALGKIDLAVEALKAAIDNEPVFADAYYNLANIYNSKQDYEKATELLKISMRLDASLAEPHYIMASIFWAKQSYNEAIDEYDKFIAKSGLYLLPYRFNAEQNISILKTYL